MIIPRIIHLYMEVGVYFTNLQFIYLFSNYYNQGPRGLTESVSDCGSVQSSLLKHSLVT